MDAEFGDLCDAILATRPTDGELEAVAYRAGLDPSVMSNGQPVRVRVPELVREAIRMAGDGRRIELARFERFKAALVAVLPAFDASRLEARIAEQLPEREPEPGAGSAFVSYLRADSGLVDRLVSDLRARGVTIWRDVDDLRPGDRWPDRIREAIGAGAAFLLCCSAHLDVRRESVLFQEFLIAKNEAARRRPGRPWIFPVLLDHGSVPRWSLADGELTNIQAADLSIDWATGIERLVDGLRAQAL